MSVEVIGPTREGNYLTFGVIRQFENLRLKFKISYEERNGKWHHGSFNKEQDGLCRERLYRPLRSCACIKACKRKLKEMKK